MTDDSSGPAVRAEPETRRRRDPDATREQLLRAGLIEFAEHGYDGARIERIVAKAGCNIRMLYHYFGNKQGLYQACASHIVARYVEAALPTSQAAVAALSTGGAEAARRHLVDVLQALARFLMNAGDSQGASLFIQRELADPGAAFDILFDQLWRPGVELVGQLISAARGAPHAPPARLEAIHLISGLTAFASGRAAIDRLLGGSADLSDELCAIVERQVEQL